MAMDPYKKRMLQGAAQGATTGATAGYMLGGPLGGTLGLIGGGVAGGLMARPGEDEQRYRARMRQLELGVLGPEEAAIRGRFMDPVRGAAQQQETARRALEQGTVTSGASARRAQAAQTAARRDIGEAAAEAEMAIMDLGERRRMMADKMRDQLRREEDQRTRQFRAQMAGDLVGLGTTVGGDIAGQRLQAASEKASLADQVGAGRGRRNRADLAAMSDEEALDAYTGGLPFVDFEGLPEAADPVAGGPSPVKVSGLGDYAMRAAASREAERRLGAIDDPSSVEAPAPAAAPPVAPAAAAPVAAATVATGPVAAAFETAAMEASTRLADARAAKDLGFSIDVSDPDYVDFAGSYVGLDPYERVDLFQVYKGLSPEAKARALTEYDSMIQLAGEL